MHLPTILTFVSFAVAVSAMPSGGESSANLIERRDVHEDVSDDWKNQVVNSHNKFRAQYGAPNLAWSDALYPGTQQWAQQCKFQHRLVSK